MKEQKKSEKAKSWKLHNLLIYLHANNLDGGVLISDFSTFVFSDWYLQLFGIHPLIPTQSHASLFHVMKIWFQIWNFKDNSKGRRNIASKYAANAIEKLKKKSSSEGAA